MNYKCIHNYPGGPDVGYISKPHKVQPDTDENCHYYNHNWFNPKLYPEFWEKVKLVAFTTEDGHEVHGEYTLFTVGVTTNCDNADYWKVSECKLNFLSPPNLVDYKWFWSRGYAEKYIEENKPQYSKKDMIEFCNYAKSYISGHTTVPKHFDHWIELNNKLKK